MNRSASRAADQIRRPDSATGKRADVAQEWCRLKGRARGLLDQWEGVNPASVAMHVLGQPALNRRHFSPSQIILPGPELGLDRLP